MQILLEFFLDAEFDFFSLIKQHFLIRFSTFDGTSSPVKAPAACGEQAATEVVRVSQQPGTAGAVRLLTKLLKAVASVVDRVSR